MPLNHFVTEAMRGLDRGQDEIAVGLGKVLRVGARVALGFFFRVVNKPRAY